MSSYMPCNRLCIEDNTIEYEFQFKSVQRFPTVVSALEAKQIQATFMIVPLAMKLREQGVPVKICYLGHRDGSGNYYCKE
jgi:NitT/TauT family transport system substrate-binding protein